mgnify:FL=1
MDENDEEQYFRTMTKKKVDAAHPNVINDEMIRNYIKEYNAENQIYGMDNMPFSQIVELRLSYQNILKISNLTGLSGLKKLCLDNNIISRIEGLDSEDAKGLESLEWLDLSFNRIKVIEGLESLVNLTDLSLFSNQIQEVSPPSLDANTKLNVLSLGDNQISSFEPTISYLRGFKHLQVLKLEGNPLTSEMTYKNYVIAYISQLKYLDYVQIDPQDMAKAKEEYRNELLSKDAQAQSEEDPEKKASEEKRIAELSEAYLEKTHNVLEKLSENNEEEEANLALLTDQEEMYREFAEKFKDKTAAFQTKIIGLNTEMNGLIEKFEKSVTKAERDCEEESIKLISAYEKEEKYCFKNFEENEEDENSEEAVKQLLSKADVLESQLIEKEMALSERLNDAINRFEKKLKTVVEQIKEEAKDFQETVNADIADYFTDLDNKMKEEIQAFSSENADMENYTPQQREVFQQKEPLTNAITTLQEEYKSAVFKIEEKVSKNYESKMEKFIEQFKEDQHDRNRNHIIEIVEIASSKRQAVDNKLAED